MAQQRVFGTGSLTTLRRNAADWADRIGQALMGLFFPESLRAPILVPIPVTKRPAAKTAPRQ